MIPILMLVSAWLGIPPAPSVVAQPATLPVSELVWTAPDRFWFRRAVEGGHVWLNVDAEYGVKEPLFDHQRLAIEIGIRTGLEYTPLGLPLASPAAQFVVKYDGSNAYIQEGAMAVEFILGGRHWRCDLQTKWNWNLVPPTDYQCASGRPIVPGVSDGPVVSPTVNRSPDGRWEAVVQAHNVVVRPTGGGATVRATTDGTADFAYHPGSLTWTADSSAVAAYRVQQQVWMAASVSGNVEKLLHRATLTVN
jgi:hypothetical protein